MPMKTYMLFPLIALIFATSFAIKAAEDYPQWRGENHWGVVAVTAKLRSTFTEKLPVRWRVPVPGEHNGGYSTPCSVNGKVYLYVNWQQDKTVKQTSLRWGSIEWAGGYQQDIAAELFAKIERARIAADRPDGKDSGVLAQWAHDWIAKTSQQRRAAPWDCLRFGA